MPPKLSYIPVLHTKKRKIGSGEVAAEDLPSIENAFNNILDTINAISTGKFEDLEDLHNIKIGVVQALDTVTNVKKWIKENPNSDLKAISFSKFDYDLLKHGLGVTVNRIDSSLMVDRFGERLIKELVQQKDTRLLNEMIEVVEARNFQPLHRLLSLIENSVHSHPEASERLLIDQWLLESIDVSSNIKGPEGGLAPEGYRSFLYTEFQLSSLNENPSRIIFNNSITYIIGSTDYALWSLPSQDISREHTKALTNKTFIFKLLTPAGTFTFFEAKRDAEDLDDHVPQAVAQCLAMCEKANWREMGFCLTTGKTWLFGIVDTAPTSKICWITNKFQIAATPEFAVVKSLVKLILLWKLQPPDVLKSAVQAI